MAKANSLADFGRFCSQLVLEDGTKMKLHQFQRTMLRDYFGGCQETLVMIPKKNGKSTLLGALALYHLTHTLDANIAIVASSRDQAMFLFEQARGFVQRTEVLDEQVKVFRGYREIRRRDPMDLKSPKKFRGLIKVYAADADTVDGWLGNVAFVDELHRHKSLDLYGVLRDGLGPRDGRMVTISTAGDTDDSPLGLLRSRAYELDVERKGNYRYVRDGGFCVHEWALDLNQDREDLKLVKSVNPAPWQTVKKLRERRKSQSMTPGQWARFACGVWGMGSEPAYDGDLWDSLAKPRKREPVEQVRISLGFDGARRKDGTGLVGCELKTGHLFVLGYWQKPIDADEEWEVPEAEVDAAVDYAMKRWKVAKFYGDPPFWESALDRWAGEYGEDTVTRWWTNQPKKTALALRAFANDMDPKRMSHDGDSKLSEHIKNSVRYETRMVEDGEALWMIRKDSHKSPRKIDLAMAAMLAWEARGDAIKGGVLNQPQYSRAAW